MALGRVFTLESTGVALFWPAAGVATLWLLRASTRAQVLVDSALVLAVTTVFLDLGVGLSFSASVLLGVAYAVQAVVARGVLARLTRRADRPGTGAVDAALVDTRSVHHLVLAAVAAALAGAPVGAVAFWVQTGEVSWSAGLNWFLQNTCGILVPAAAALAWEGAREHRRSKHWREWLTAEPRRGAALELALAATVTVCIGVVVAELPEQIPVMYLVMATSAWVGFRFVPAVGGLYTLVFGVLAVGFTLAGVGPFGFVEDLVLRANDIQLFVTVTMLLVLLLACGVGDRATLSAQLRESDVRATIRADLLGAVNGAIVDGLCVSDSWGHVLLANPAAAELGGADEHGTHVHDASSAQWYWPDGTPIATEDFPHARALRGEVVAMTDVIRRDTATGEEKVLAVSAVPLQFGVQEQVEVEEAGPLAVVTMRDVTAQRAQQRAQENFVAVVAHDLKGPVSGVLSWAELAQEQLASEQEGQREAAGASLQRIERSADRMSLLITDLLDYTVAGSAPLHIRTVDLDDLVDSIAADLERPDGAAVLTHAPLGTVLADELLTRQLFGNLIGNAIKYVAPGVAPRIRIESDPREDVLEIRVSDNGVGIPARDRAHVFDSFFRAGGTSAVPGSGLGLAICRRAVERHGGWIVAREGPEGAGTTIVFTLPLMDAGTGTGAPGLDSPPRVERVAR